MRRGKHRVGRKQAEYPKVRRRDRLDVDEGLGADASEDGTDTEDLQDYRDDPGEVITEDLG